MKALLLRIWDSPTATTWASFGAKSLNFVLVLPLILSKFSTGDIALWYLFLTILSFQILVDFGFSPTFIRVIAYAKAGANHIKDLRLVTQLSENQSANWELISKIVSTMSSIYLKLTFAIFLLLSGIGTWVLINPISFVENQQQAWIAWVIIVFSMSISFFGGTYSNYLQGINKIAVYRRWDTITSLGAILSSFAALFFYSNLLLLVVVNQSWIVINVLRNYWLCKRLEGGRYFQNLSFKIDAQVFDSVVSSAWKSGLGMMMAYGALQSSGIILAQFGDVAKVASYLLGLRILQAIISFAQAPFYSKIPLLSRLRAEGNADQSVRVAQRGMLYSHWIFVILFIGISLMGPMLMVLIKSNAEFPDRILWSLFGLAFFVERYGAMHIQFYSTTNHVLWHIANGVSGVIFISISYLFFPMLNIYVFPTALLIGYISFYAWYSAIYSFRIIKVNYITFEKNAALFPFLAMLIFLFLYNMNYQ